MPKGIKKKEWVKFNIKLDKEISEKLAEYTAENGQSKTWVVEKALKKFLNMEEDKKT